MQEARTVARLEHSHIVPIFAISEPPAWPYFTMKLIEGRDLASVLKSHSVSDEESLRWLAQVGSALDYAHSQGVAHRDIKPANILIDSEGEARLTDFGIARALDESRQQLTHAETMLGTPEYLSPEQAGSGKAIGPASDQYSLTVLAYELFTGTTPFRSADATTLSLGLAHLRATPPSPRKLRPHSAASYGERSATRSL
ncbi:MAG: serine/threonine-protein kinase [Armatimonas sp.]